MQNIQPLRPRPPANAHAPVRPRSPSDDEEAPVHPRSPSDDEQGDENSPDNNGQPLLPGKYFIFHTCNF